METEREKGLEVGLRQSHITSLRSGCGGIMWSNHLGMVVAVLICSTKKCFFSFYVSKMLFSNKKKVFFRKN